MQNQVFFENHFNLVIPEIFLSCCGLLLLVYGVLLGSNTRILTKNISWIAILSMLITSIIIMKNCFGSWIIFNEVLSINNFSSSIKIFVLLSSCACLLISLTYMKKDKINLFEYPILIILSVLGMLFLISSHDLIPLYLAVELQSLCFYVLATLKRNSTFSTEAGLKYFILGAFSSGLLLFGSSLIYGFLGTTNFEEISKLVSCVQEDSFIYYLGLNTGMIFVAAALLFKLGAFPFHMWLPDVYEGVATSVTAFFAAVPKIVLFGLFIRLFGSVLIDLIGEWQKMIIFCSFGSMLVGAFGGLYQRKLKRLFAYSAIGHCGYMLIGIASGSFQGLFIYVIIYIFMTLGIFSVLLSLRDQEQGSRPKYITDFLQLSKVNPILAISITFLLFSMAGIPPLAGFYGKFNVFLAGVESSLYTLVFFGVIFSTIGSVYYIRIIKILYFDKSKKVSTYQPLDRESSLVLGISTFFTLLLLAFPAPLLLLTEKIFLSL